MKTKIFANYETLCEWREKYQYVINEIKVFSSLTDAECIAEYVNKYGFTENGKEI